MKDFTEKQLEEIENSLIETIDDNLKYMVLENKRDLISMIIDDLQTRWEELR